MSPKILAAHQGPAKKKIDSLREIEKKDPGVKKKESNESSSNKQRYLEKKEYERNLRKLRSKLEKSEKKIEKLESEITLLENTLSQPGKPADEMDELYRRYRMSAENLDNEMKRWEQYTHDVEVFLKNNSR